MFFRCGFPGEDRNNTFGRQIMKTSGFTARELNLNRGTEAAVKKDTQHEEKQPDLKTPPETLTRRSRFRRQLLHQGYQGNCCGSGRFVGQRTSARPKRRQVSP